MYLLEIAAQGVRGFSASCRAGLAPGYILLRPPTPAPPPMAGIALALFFYDGRGSDSVYAVPGSKGRVAFSLLANDSNTYRVLRELGGSGALQRFDPAAQQFSLMSENPTEVGEFLKTQVGLPQRAVYEALFCLSPGQMPTQKPKRAKAQAQAAASVSKERPSLQNQLSIEAASDVPAAKAKVEALQKELAFSKGIEQIQFQIDGLASDSFDIERKLSPLESARSLVAEAQAAYDAAPSPESLQLPRDIVARLEKFPSLVAKRDESLTKVRAELESAIEPLMTPLPEPVWKDHRFIAGVAVGVVALLVGLVVSGWFKYVALLEIPAFGFAAFLAIRYVDEIQESEKANYKGDRLEQREKKIKDQFDQDVRDVQKTLEIMGVDKPEDAINIFAKKALLGEKLEQVREELRLLEEDPAYIEASQKLAGLKAEQERLNAELLQRGGNYFREAREVEREIGRIQQSIAMAERGDDSDDVTVVSNSPFALEQFEDPAPALLRAAAEAFSSDVAGVAGVVRDRAVQYFAALTDKRYIGLELDRDGRAVGIAPNGKVRAQEMPGRDVDMLYLALKLTLVEKYSARFKIPMFIDEGSYVDESKAPLLGRMFKHVGTLTQVLQVSSLPAYASVADATSNL